MFADYVGSQPRMSADSVSIETESYRLSGLAAVHQIIRDLRFHRVDWFHLRDTTRSTRIVVNYCAS